MPKISVDANGRFGHMLKEAAIRKGLSLADIAREFDYAYEQIRKLVEGKSGPGDKLLKGLCKFLDLNQRDADRAVLCDSLERSYGVEKIWEVLGRDPRLAEIEPLLPLLTKQEWEMFITQLSGMVRERQRRQK